MINYVSIAAKISLIGLHLQSCGAKYDMEGDPFEEMDVDNVVIALVNLATKVFSTVYNFS